MLAEFGDDPDRYADAKARKNYAGTTPITRPPARRRSSSPATSTTTARRRLDHQAFAALRASPGARAYYDKQRARGTSHHPALRALANRLVGILHGCLKTGTLYDGAPRLAQRTRQTQPSSA